MGVPSGTGFPSPSLTVTLKVDVLVPSAGTLAGSAVTVELPTPSNVTLPEAIIVTGRVSESTAAICTVVVAGEFASMPVRSAGVQKKLIFAPRVWKRRNLPSILTPELLPLMLQPAEPTKADSPVTPITVPFGASVPPIRMFCTATVVGISPFAKTLGGLTTTSADEGRVPLPALTAVVKNVSMLGSGLRATSRAPDTRTA